MHSRPAGHLVKTQPFLRSFVTPAALCAFGFLAAMTAVLQYSVRAFIPGSLEPGGFTLENFVALMKPLYARVFIDTVWICFLTAFFTLIVGYPLAYALVHVQNKIVKSFMLITVVTPLFLGEVVRTYSWIIVLGSNGFINSVLLKARRDRTADPIHVHDIRRCGRAGPCDDAGHGHHSCGGAFAYRPQLQRAAESLGAGPIRAFVTVTLPLSMPGIIAGVTTAFAWTFSAFATPQLIGGGRVNMISNLVYQLGFASFDFPFAASLCVSGLALVLVVTSLTRLALRPLEKIGPH